MLNAESSAKFPVVLANQCRGVTSISTRELKSLRLVPLTKGSPSKIRIATAKVL